MDLKLKNKVAFVTGSTQGVGFATAKKLCDEGAYVYINGRNKQNVQDAIEKIRRYNPYAKIEGVVANLSTKKGCDEIIKALPKIDILINNLGVFKPKDFTSLNEDDWQTMFNINVMSGVRLSQYYISSMLKQNWGRIIFISSESAYQIPKEMIHYGMTKTAQLSVARGIAELTAGTNVTSNSIIIGPTKSEGVTTFLNDYAKQMNYSFEQMQEEFFKNIRPTSLLKRFTEVEEVSNMIVYTASPLSSATNGAVLRADAGIVQSVF